MLDGHHNVVQACAFSADSKAVVSTNISCCVPTMNVFVILQDIQCIFRIVCSIFFRSPKLPHGNFLAQALYSITCTCSF